MVLFSFSRIINRYTKRTSNMRKWMNFVRAGPKIRLFDSNSFCLTFIAATTFYASSDKVKTTDSKPTFQLVTIKRGFLVLVVFEMWHIFITFWCLYQTLWLSIVVINWREYKLIFNVLNCWDRIECLSEFKRHNGRVADFWNCINLFELGRCTLHK